MKTRRRGSSTVSASTLESTLDLNARSGHRQLVMNYELSLCLLLVAATHTGRSTHDIVRVFTCSVCTATFAQLEIGSLPNLQHGVSGTLYVDNDVTLRIENFRYDGLGPSTWVTFLL